MSITTRSPRNFNWGSDETGPYVGPGSYNLPGSIIKLKETPYPFNTTAARDSPIKNDNPSPADYYPEIPRLSIPTSAGMRSRSPRYGWMTSDTPSPVEYQHIENWKPRINRNRREPMSSRSPRITFTGDKQLTTSPADRDIRPKYDRGVTIAKTGRNFYFENPNGFKTPGPGSYNVARGGIDMKNKGHRSAAFMTESERDIFKSPDWTSNDCGLDHTNWKLDKKSIAPFGSKARKQNFWASNKNPGPGAYNVAKNLEVRQSRGGFGSASERRLFDISDTPGPGEYKIERKRKWRSDSEHPFLTKAERFQSAKKEYDAEPASYNVDFGDRIQQAKKQARQSASFMCSIDRNPYKVTSKTPGAGAYSPEKVKNRHKLMICIDGSERSKPNTMFGQPIPDNPAPCAYNIQEPPSSARGVYIRHSKRGQLGGPTDVPSPDTYHVDSTLLKPSFNVTYSIAKL